MADDTPLELIVGEADGYCDPETGVCALPAAPDQEEPTSPEHVRP